MTAIAAPRSLPAPGAGADRAIRVSTAAVVVAVAGIAAYISYWHAYAVVRQWGESGVTALLEPATIDGLVYASSMVILHAAWHRLPVPRLARWMLALGIAASLAVNVAQGWSHGPIGAVVAAWPAVSLVGSYELLAWIIRTAAPAGPDHVPVTDHSGPQATSPVQACQPGPPPDSARRRRTGSGITLAWRPKSRVARFDQSALRRTRRPGQARPGQTRPDGRTRQAVRTGPRTMRARKGPFMHREASPARPPVSTPPQ
ncbi:MAG TPA: DUF2637 domain-containing protein [Trebonia sp.]|nr:DUF2637 domain-containing protein [Trebonia sp.]